MSAWKLFKMRCQPTLSEIIQKANHRQILTGCSFSSTGASGCVQVPFRLLKAFHKIQQRLVRELEKKFSGKDVVIVANRRILAPPKSGYSKLRPRSRTLTAVSHSLLSTVHQQLF